MTFTKTPPQQPGFYAWRLHEGSTISAEYMDAEDTMKTEKIVGEWCRLVPSEEVDAAYREGYEDRTSFRQLESDDWNNSRAKRVAEGAEWL